MSKLTPTEAVSAARKRGVRERRNIFANGDLWERACSRIGRYIHAIFSVWNAVFVSKLTPTGGCLLQQRVVSEDAADVSAEYGLWERACSR
ncbi:hypothetical protein, partial [Pseudomonas sp. W2-17]|uniref:hypothetical protein n=1 Tax=Pseudomonas sp. W2-17 TaxID=3058039 RepID=UPI0034E09389